MRPSQEWQVRIEAFLQVNREVKRKAWGLFTWWTRTWTLEAEVSRRLVSTTSRCATMDKLFEILEPLLPYKQHGLT